MVTHTLSLSRQISPLANFSRCDDARPRSTRSRKAQKAMVEQKAAVAMMEIEQSELNRVSEAFGYNLISTSRLTGGYASSNFAAVLRPCLLYTSPSPRDS